jgi:hypothetical protein
MNAWKHCRCKSDIISQFTNRVIQRPGMLVTRVIGPVGVVRCTNNCHNCCSSRKLILCISPPIAWVHLAVDLATFRVCLVHSFKINVRLTWEIRQKYLYTCANIYVVRDFEDVQIIFNPTIIGQPKIQCTDELSYSIWWLKSFDVEDVQCSPCMLMYPRLFFLAEWLSLWNVMCCLKRITWIPLFWVLVMLIVQSSCFAIWFPPAFSTLTTCLWVLVFVGSGVQVRSLFWESILSWSWVFSGGGTPCTLCVGPWISSQSLLMAIEVQRVKSNYVGLYRSQPAGCQIPPGNILSLIDIGWYCGFWDCSWFTSNIILWNIKPVTCSCCVLTIFERWSLKTYSDEFRQSCTGWYTPSAILTWRRANSGWRNTVTGTLHTAKYRRERSFVITVITTLGSYTPSLYVMPALHAPSSW